MASRVLITVDTELTWRPYARGASWEENLHCSFDPAGVGVPYQLEQLRAHGLKACFFVDPMPALVYGLEPVRRMVEPILAAGQEVQLHIHPVWQSISEGRAGGADFELTCFDAGAQQALIARARDLLVEAGAPPPVAFRSGSFAADRDTLRALRKLGIGFDSSHNGSEHPCPSNLPLPAATVAPREVEGIVEIPVSQLLSDAGALRPLQLCAVSTPELHQALRHAARNDHPTTTIVGHSFELATRDGRRINKIVKARFDALCSFLSSNREDLPTAHFSDLASLDLLAAAVPLRSEPIRKAHRVVEQIWAEARYERPAQPATALCGGSVSFLEMIVPYVL